MPRNENRPVGRGGSGGGEVAAQHTSALSVPPQSKSLRRCPRCKAEFPYQRVPITKVRRFLADPHPRRIRTCPECSWSGASQWFTAVSS